jgi:hypothetical protein
MDKSACAENVEKLSVIKMCHMYMLVFMCTSAYLQITDLVVCDDNELEVGLL